MPRMRWRPGLRTGPRWPLGKLTTLPQTHQSAGEGDTPSRRTPPVSAPRSSRFRRSLLGASFLAYTHLNFQQYTTNWFYIVISLSRCCLPDDEGPGPPNIFSQNRHCPYVCGRLLLTAMTSPNFDQWSTHAFICPMKTLKHWIKIYWLLPSRALSKSDTNTARIPCTTDMKLCLLV